MSKREKEIYKILFACSSDALLLVAKDGTVCNSSKEFLRMSGLSREQVIGQNLQDVTMEFGKHESLKGRLPMAFQNVFRIDNSILLEPLISENHKIFNEHIDKWYKQTLSPIPVDGVIEYVLYKVEIVNFDSTPIRFKEIEIDNVQYERLVSSAKDYATFMIDASGIIITWNKGAEHLKQYSADDVIGKHISMFYSDEEKTSGKPEKFLYTALKNGHSEEEGWRIRKDGSKFWADITTTPVIGSKGELIGYVNLTRDLTERKLSEAKRIKSVHEANQILLREQLAIKDVELKTRFLSNMSHELRTPVHGITAYLDFLSETKLTEQQNEYVDAISACVGFLNTIVNDLTDISKLENGQVTLEYQVFNPVQILENTISLSKISALNKQLNIILNVSESFPRYVNGDPNRFQQILVNILSNAIKFTASGSIIVRGWCEVDSDRDQEYKIFLRVTDSGIGMTAETVKGLLSSFSQADSSTTRSSGGAGVGFLISLQLVRLMGGNIAVETEPGKGTTVEVSLFMKKPFIKPDVIKEQNAVSSTKSPQPLSGYRILVFEDNIVNQSIVKKALVTAGAQVFCAGNGQIGLNDWRSKPNFYNLLLLDCHMPVLDGYETAKILRKEECNVPIIALTADVLVENRKKCLEAGMDECITKPVKPAELVRLIALCLKVEKNRPQEPSKMVQNTPKEQQ